MSKALRASDAICFSCSVHRRVDGLVLTQAAHPNILFIGLKNIARMRANFDLSRVGVTDFMYEESLFGTWREDALFSKSESDLASSKVDFSSTRGYRVRMNAKAVE